MKKQKTTLNKRSFNIKNILKKAALIFLTVVFIALIPNIYVFASSVNSISTKEKANGIKADCILVLGAGIKGLSPSDMLKERLDTAISLYESGVSSKIVMSGDHSSKYYNEVGVMKAYAMEKGVPSYDIFMDHSGFSTYESLYRIKEVFGCNKIFAVTQRYHLYRTVYLGKSLNLEITGVDVEGTRYVGQLYRDLREFVARDKDFFTGIFKPEISFSNKISISGNGDLTNDEDFLKIIKEKGLKLAN